MRASSKGKRMDATIELELLMVPLDALEKGGSSFGALFFCSSSLTFSLDSSGFAGVRESPLFLFCTYLSFRISSPPPPDGAKTPGSFNGKDQRNGGCCGCSTQRADQDAKGSFANSHCSSRDGRSKQEKRKRRMKKVTASFLYTYRQISKEMVRCTQ